MKSKWKNYGDVNFISWGGCIVKPHWTEDEIKDHPSLKNQYDVFRLLTADNTGEENIYHAALHVVDVDDFINSEHKNALLNYIGQDNKKDFEPYDIMDPEVWAKEIVEAGYSDATSTYKSNYPFAEEDYLITGNQLKDYMNNLELSEFYKGSEIENMEFTTEDDVRIWDELEVDLDKTEIDAAYELYVDVDEKFLTDTKDDDDTWINFYTIYNPIENTIRALYYINTSDSDEEHEYHLSDQEKRLFIKKMQEYCNEKYGQTLYELYETVKEED